MINMKEQESVVLFWIVIGLYIHGILQPLIFMEVHMQQFCTHLYFY